MNEKEYLSALEYELRGLPPAEKEEALEFMTEYLEEACSQKPAEEVICSLPSPKEYARGLIAEIEQSAESDSIKPDFFSAITRSGKSAAISKMPDIPDEAAALKPDAAHSPKESLRSGFSAMTGWQKALTVAGAAVLLPIAAVLAACAVVLVFSIVLLILMIFLFLVLLGIMIAMVVFCCLFGAAALFVRIAMLIFSDPVGAVFDLGMILLLAGIGILSGLACSWYFRNFLPYLIRAAKRFTDMIKKKISRKRKSEFRKAADPAAGRKVMYE